MRWGGAIILLFVIYHVLDLSTGDLNPSGKRGKVYENVVADFAPHRWYITLWYVIAMLAVGFHLRHGIYSAARTLGQRSTHGEVVARQVALWLAVLITAGFLIVPFAVTFGLVS
jgi:succinate dehydrogenase / fumarate reductase cytochrome b subunit